MTDIYENKLDECSLTFDEYRKQYGMGPVFKTVPCNPALIIGLARV